MDGSQFAQEFRRRFRTKKELETERCHVQFDRIKTNFGHSAANGSKIFLDFKISFAHKQTETCHLDSVSDAHVAKCV